MKYESTKFGGGDEIKHKPQQINSISYTINKVTDVIKINGPNDTVVEIKCYPGEAVSTEAASERPLLVLRGPSAGWDASPACPASHPAVDKRYRHIKASQTSLNGLYIGCV